MRSLQPQVKAIQQRYAGDQERIQLEIARLYKLAGVNPLAGCLPTLATIPVWIGLYRALSNVANEGLLTKGFFWIPSLAGPTTIAARQSGSGTSWLFPFIDGHPPLGWSDTLAYLVLPVLLGGDPSQKSSQALTKLLPLMIGYFALSVPSGLSLYRFTNNILSTAQQIWLQKLGEKAKSSQGAKTNPGGLPCGERFKQIKEQEARRRKHREEEKKRAQEVAEGSRTITEQQNSEVKSLENKIEQEPGKDQTDADLSSSDNDGLNGNAGSVLSNDRSLHEKEKK
ncbi:putative ALBINO3-like protein 1, chloroplastic [Cocos nucifera]|uniref:Putative ALBINO3-like protein 1, chloroplastic n=1 Tax=Cocos nucifera TaxID=13894 RepID=A0A8K0N8F8_COCNU|nr:putative ALBINO3-like protein 1, chloroplastic [Cocos nucifera]